MSRFITLIGAGAKMYIIGMNTTKVHKFTYENSTGYKNDRIFYPYIYRHPYDEDKLEELLDKYYNGLVRIHQK